MRTGLAISPIQPFDPHSFDVRISYGGDELLMR